MNESQETTLSQMAAEEGAKSLPRELWEGDINAALNHYVALPTEGEQALEDRAEYPAFSR